MWSFKHNEHPAFTKGFILLTPKSSLFSRDSRLELGDFLGRVVVERNFFTGFSENGFRSVEKLVLISASLF